VSQIVSASRPCRGASACPGCPRRATR
jgi:hypothetical protein